jgi:hypothetical protein
MTDGGKTSAEEQANEHVKYFFLDLAAKGKDAWNSWCRANKDVHVTFAGVDFSVAPKDQINFSGFEFGNEADFSGCKWRGVEFDGEIPIGFKPGHAWFTSAIFGHKAHFKKAISRSRSWFFISSASVLRARKRSGTRLSPVKWKSLPRRTKPI